MTRIKFLTLIISIGFIIAVLAGIAFNPIPSPVEATDEPLSNCFAAGHLNEVLRAEGQVERWNDDIIYGCRMEDGAICYVFHDTSMECNWESK